MYFLRFGGLRHRGEERVNAMALGPAELGDDVRVAVTGVADRRQVGLRNGDDDERCVEPPRELERLLLRFLRGGRAVRREQDWSRIGHLDLLPGGGRRPDGAALTPTRR
jgi:hypothetical protein